MKAMPRLISATAIVLLPAVCPAQIARVEVHPVQSVTMADQDFLNGRKDGKPVMLAGQLRIPRPGADKLPAVVLLHGSGGVGRNVEHPFGTIKFWNDQRHFLMRGLENVRGEFSLSALAYNIKRAITLVGVSRLVAAVS